MSFLFGRGRARASTVDLPKQAKEQIQRLDGPGGAAKVELIPMARIMLHTDCVKTEELSKTLLQIKLVLQGSPGKHYPS